jgi:hypothetical protein
MVLTRSILGNQSQWIKLRARKHHPKGRIYPSASDIGKQMFAKFHSLQVLLTAGTGACLCMNRCCQAASLPKSGAAFAGKEKCLHPTEPDRTMHALLARRLFCGKMDSKQTADSPCWEQQCVSILCTGRSSQPFFLFSPSFQSLCFSYALFKFVRFPYLCT